MLRCHHDVAIANLSRLFSRHLPGTGRLWKATSLDLWARLAVASLVVFFFPVSENIYCSEVSLLLLVLLLLMQRATQRGHDFIAGAALALASLLKLYPIIALGYLALW